MKTSTIVGVSLMCLVMLLGFGGSCLRTPKTAPTMAVAQAAEEPEVEWLWRVRFMTQDGKCLRDCIVEGVDREAQNGVWVVSLRHQGKFDRNEKDYDTLYDECIENFQGYCVFTRIEPTPQNTPREAK